MLQDRPVGQLSFDKRATSVVIDLSQSFPGDLLGEFFIDSFPQFLRSFFEKVSDSGKEWKVRVSHQSYKSKIQSLFESDVKISIGQRIALYDQQYRLKEGIELFEGSALYSLLKETQSSVQSPFPLCLWGSVPQMGLHWLRGDISLAEVFQIEGNGQTKVEKILFNGPFGQLENWAEVKGKMVSELDEGIKSIHFLDKAHLKTFQTLWDEFFSHDSCFQCMPCSLKRALLEKGEEMSFNNDQIYDCHLPSLYQKKFYFLGKEGCFEQC